MVGKKKLLILIKNIDGGTGTFLFQLLKLNKDFDIIVCALERRRYGEVYFYKDILYCGDRASSLNYYSLSFGLLIKIVQEIVWFTKVIRHQKPDLILSIDTHCNLLSALVGKVLYRNTKVVATLHNNITKVAERKTPSLIGILRFIGKHALGNVDAIVSPSNGVARDLKNFFLLKNRVKVIYYGLNSSEVKKKKSERIPNQYKNIFNNGKVKIISIGRFEEQKDFATLIKAFRKITTELKNTQLILIGDGENRKFHEELVKKLKIEQSVHFLGWQENVYPYLMSSGVFIMSSHYEGFGYVLIEAMACGLPIVSTDTPFGPGEVLDKGKYGILVPIGDIDKMEKVINNILTDRVEHKKYSLLSRKRSKFYDEGKMLKQYKKLIRDLL